MKEIKQYDIIRLHNLKEQEIQDEVIVEYSLCIFLKGKEYVTLLCTPKALKSLVVGYLYSIT